MTTNASAGDETRRSILALCQRLRLKELGAHIDDAVSNADSYESFLLDLLQYQANATDGRAAERRIKAAKFPYRKYIEDLDRLSLPRGMRTALPELETLKFIRDGQNVLLIGNPGTGKTHTAIALGIKACEQGYKVLFTNIPLLVTELRECTSENRLGRFQKRFASYDLVIADELGYISFDRTGSDLLFTCLSQRSMEKSIILTSNLTFERWKEVFGDAAVTGAMVDRLTFGARIIDMTGESYRLKMTMQMNGISAPQPADVGTGDVQSGDKSTGGGRR